MGAQAPYLSMPDTNDNIIIERGAWRDLYALSGIAVGTQLTVENVGSADILLAVQAAQPAPDFDKFNVLRRENGILSNSAGDSGAWAFCHTNGKVNVSTPAKEGFRPYVDANLRDGAGTPIDSLGGAIDVHDADVHQIVVNDYVHRHDVTVQTTLTVAASKGDTQLTVVDITGFSLGDLIHLGQLLEFVEPVHPVITVAPVGNTLVLDRPLDNDFAIGALVTKSVPNLASLGGTLASPVAYRYFPSPGRIEHISRIILSMIHSTAADDSSFGDLAALTNGVVLRASVGGIIGTFTNWKTNGDILLDVFDLTYTDKAGGGKFGTAARGAFSDIDVAVRLDQTQGDYFEVLIQDNVTALDDFRIKAQGHVEGG